MNKESDGTVYHQWSRGDGHIARLIHQEYNGHDLLHLRIFYLDKNGKLKPAAKGVTIPHDQIAPLRKALRKARKELSNKSTDDPQPVKARRRPNARKSQVGARPNE